MGYSSRSSSSLRCAQQLGLSGPQVGQLLQKVLLIDHLGKPQRENERLWVKIAQVLSNQHLGLGFLWSRALYINNGELSFYTGRSNFLKSVCRMFMQTRTTKVMV